MGSSRSPRQTGAEFPRAWQLLPIGGASRMLPALSSFAISKAGSKLSPGIRTTGE